MEERNCSNCAKINDRCYCAPGNDCEMWEPLQRVLPVWNVYRYSFNSGKVETMNIFNHWRFDEDVQNDLRKCRSKEEFADKLRSNLMYYFWSKCECEIIISSWPYTEKSAEKIDIYQQVMMNWSIFLEYVWSFRKEVRNAYKKNTSRKRRAPSPEEIQEEGATTG